jgi:hypothetical protein
VVPDDCGLHVAPPSAVPTISPRKPAAMQSDVLGQLIARRSYAAPELRGVQSAPWSVVFSMVPSSPTAKHNESDPGHANPKTVRGAPFKCWTQPLPPVVVVTTLPYVPTRVHMFTVAQLAPKRALPTPDGEGTNVYPEPTVITPELPAATHSDTAGHVTVHRSSVVPELAVTQQHPGPLSRIVPPLPTATQKPATQDTALRSADDGERFGDPQLTPSAVVFRVSLAPTAAHPVGLQQLMPFRMAAVPDDSAAQVAPPLLVTRILPASPSAKQVEVVGQLTPAR